MASLTDVSTPRRHDDAFHLDVPTGWKQGRGAFGGYTIAALIRAIEQRVGDPARKVRTVTAELPSPVEPGAAQITVDLMRTGKSLSAARAALVQHGEVRGHAVAILAASRPGHGPLAWRDLAPPEAPPWKSIAPLEMQHGVWPEFAQHFEYRVVSGLPIADGSPARTVGWIRPREHCNVCDTGYVASVMDAWWPAAFTKFPPTRPCATIAFTLEMVTDVDGLAPDAPLLYRGTVPVCADGYFLETRELWGEDGRLVAINHQTFAVI
jgi:acyl-CoA thioesterase